MNVLKTACLILCFCLCGPPAFGKEKVNNPYNGASKAKPPKRAKALFTTIKRHPSKEEQKAAFDDYRIPPEQRHNYVAQYRVPISLGGSNAYANIEVLAKDLARVRRKVEKDLEKKLRRGEISTDEAQFRILNWTNEPSAKR
jgi:hypothetical protein